MQAAWIISMHFVEAWLFETSPVLGLQGAGGSKNTISQVVSHELKIAKHGFPGRLLYCPSNPPTPTYLHLTPYAAHNVSWQKAAFPPTWWRNLPEWKRKGEKEGGKKSANWSGQRYMTHIPSHSPHPSPTMLWLSSKDVFTMFYHPIFFGVYFRDVWIRWQTGRKCGRDTSAELR